MPHGHSDVSWGMPRIHDHANWTLVQQCLPQVHQKASNGIQPKCGKDDVIVPEFQAHPRHSHKGPTWWPPYQKPPWQCQDEEKLWLPPFSRFNWELSFSKCMKFFDWQWKHIGKPIRDQGRGFPINKHWFQPNPSVKTHPLHIAYFIFIIYFTHDITNECSRMSIASRLAAALRSPLMNPPLVPDHETQRLSCCMFRTVSWRRA